MAFCCLKCVSVGIGGVLVPGRLPTAILSRVLLNSVLPVAHLVSIVLDLVIWARRFIKILSFNRTLYFQTSFLPRDTSTNMARGRRRNTSRTAAKPPPKEVEEEEEIEEVDLDNGADNGFVTTDQVGEVDMEEEDLEEIELSSDEEDDDADVALVVMKRPPVTTKTVDMLELGDDEDEGPVVAGVKKAGINTREVEGFVKEYIETEGLGVLFTRDFGLVLFHLETVWLEGKQHPPGREC